MMSLKPYGSTKTREEEVRSMFDFIAPTYDRLNHMLSFNFDKLWRRRLAIMAARRHPHSVLDLATGTADLAISLARRIPRAHITGVDISAGMIEVGHKKVARKALNERISLELGNARHLWFADGSFDCVVAGFGVRNFENIPAALTEMHRVVRGGGELYILEFSLPKAKIFGALYRLYFRTVLPRIGGAVSRDPAAYKYLPASVDEFPEKSRFLHMIGQAGFQDCRARMLFGGAAYIYSGRKI